MIPVFKNEKDWQRMKSIIESWIGTPYKHLIMVKGRGADCTLFIGACWKEFGIIKKVSYNYYPRQWHTNTNEEKVLDSFFRHWNEYKNPGFAFEDIPITDKKMRGDLLAFSTTSQNVSNHTSIYMGKSEIGVKRMCHSIQGRGVSLFPYGGYWERKLTRIFRVLRIE